MGDVARPRVTLRAALRKYWLWLAPLVLLAVVWVAFVAPAEHPPLLVFAAFPLCTAVAAWPWLAKDAPYSFWGIACLLWVVVPVLTMIVKEFI